MKLIIIAAIGKNNELGINNDLIWKIKEDLSFFKRITMNHNILMGKNTFLSLPNLLEGRKHLVLSSTMNETKEIKIYRNLYDFLNDESLKNETIFIIGGASIYTQLINNADEMILTEIDKKALADEYFPKFKIENYTSIIIDDYSKERIPYIRKRYIRKN